MAGASSGFVLSSSDIAHANSLSNDKPASNSREPHPKWQRTFPIPYITVTRFPNLRHRQDQPRESHRSQTLTRK
ncbi:hypothetical protein SNOG_00759 [Parastagonospora nodorum SN15]|uniref:Uncharacterized protein n=1 Tax=Phaeosphaeria nodorum (strain SN15 / ATCC MYA-4574 / FGSC 10173) TaxID=321614 RepID=Q0V5F5_PHANO|nr:hypothetical protein SNOG_00759 [Parastagonospora nodorum SN15]EAT92254.1 hypothetical protein SNOG_00759 [Parastagonospora nodorum SN15]